MIQKTLNNLLSKAGIRAGFLARGMDVFSCMSSVGAFDYLEPEKIRQYQNESLVRIYRKSLSSTDYYRKSWGVDEPDELSLDSLASMPCLEKTDLRELVRELAQNDNRVGGVTRITAGTTGVPIEVGLCTRSYESQLAARAHYFSWYGIGLGSREARFWNRDSSSQREKLNDFLLNRKRFQFIGKERRFLSKEIESLKAYAPEYFYGYSSLLLECAKAWAEVGQNPLNLKAIICTAESIMDFQKAYVSRVFGCPVVMEYGCSEMDILAFQCPEGSYHINVANVILEVDAPAGEFGNIIVTDIKNESTPILRYNLGDIGRISLNKCQCGRTTPVLDGIQGRTISQLVHLPSGKTIHAVTFANIIETVVEDGIDIIRFHVLQSKSLDSFTVTVEVGEDVDRAALESRLLGDLGTKVGSSLTYNICFGNVRQEEFSKFSYFTVEKS